MTSGAAILVVKGDETKVRARLLTKLSRCMLVEKGTSSAAMPLSIRLLLPVEKLRRLDCWPNSGEAMHAGLGPDLATHLLG